MRLAYPAVLRELPDAVLVSFPDVPEALTAGETVEDAMREAVDCLVAALGGYVRNGQRIPVPSERPNARWSGCPSWRQRRWRCTKSCLVSLRTRLASRSASD